MLTAPATIKDLSTISISVRSHSRARAKYSTLCAHFDKYVWKKRTTTTTKSKAQSIDWYFILNMYIKCFGFGRRGIRHYNNNQCLWNWGLYVCVCVRARVALCSQTNQQINKQNQNSLAATNNERTEPNQTKRLKRTNVCLLNFRTKWIAHWGIRFALDANGKLNKN